MKELATWSCREVALETEGTAWWVSNDVSHTDRGSRQSGGGAVRKAMDDQIRQGFEGHCMDVGFFSLSEMESHYRVLSKGVTWYYI